MGRDDKLLFVASSRLFQIGPLAVTVASGSFRFGFPQLVKFGRLMSGAVPTHVLTVESVYRHDTRSTHQRCVDRYTSPRPPCAVGLPATERRRAHDTRQSPRLCNSPDFQRVNLRPKQNQIQSRCAFRSTSPIPAHWRRSANGSVRSVAGAIAKTAPYGLPRLHARAASPQTRRGRQQREPGTCRMASRFRRSHRRRAPTRATP
jgi:hypothetical protein